MTEKQGCEFKSAEELGLTHKEWAALITVLPLLEHDVIRHAPEASDRLNFRSLGRRGRGRGKPVFNMESWNENLDCGTAMCIGGSAEQFGKLKPQQLSCKADDLEDNGNRALHDLFYPYEIGSSWRNLTPQMAACALRHYLTTGQPGGWTHAAKQFGYEIEE